jgi:hypothetical protein
MRKVHTKSAFPLTVNHGQSFEMGMTLRDYFAAKAMAALVNKVPVDAVKSAYRIADRMMEERGKRDE